jgi:nicotinate-nucleotide--dimethylbenzimidazole phosphoribosyltransferase
VHDIPALAARMTLPDEAVRKQAIAALERTSGAYGRLGDLAIWLAAVQGQWPPEPITRPVLILLGDGAPPAPLVELAAAHLRSIPDDDVPADVGEALARGSEIASAEIDAGADLVLLASSADPLPAIAATAVLTNSEVAAMIGHGPGLTDRDWMRACASVRDAARSARPYAGKIVEMLDALASPSLAAAAGILTEASARRTGVVLDDVVAAAAGLIGQRISYRTARWCSAAQRSPEPAYGAALERLRLTPVVDYGMAGGSGDRTGVGALLALSQLGAVPALFR